MCCRVSDCSAVFLHLSSSLGHFAADRCALELWLDAGPGAEAIILFDDSSSVSHVLALIANREGRVRWLLNSPICIIFPYFRTHNPQVLVSAVLFLPNSRKLKGAKLRRRLLP